MSNPKFAETYNLVAFLEKLEENDGFKEIINFLSINTASTNDNTSSLNINTGIPTGKVWVYGKKGLKRLRKVGSTSRVESSNDVSLGDQEDASKHGRKLEDLDADAEVTLMDKTQEMNDDKDFQEELQVIEEEERMSRQKEEEDKINFIWGGVVYELAQRLQVEEQGELTIEERSKLFVELMDKEEALYKSLRAEEIKDNHQPSQTRKSNVYLLKNIANYKHNSFVPIDTEVVEGSKSQAEGSKKRTREE
ncbi:hypothetical protein Tco_0289415 [Tanacetum coccineum]